MQRVQRSGSCRGVHDAEKSAGCREVQWGTEGEKGCKGAQRLQGGEDVEEWRV